jgi:hypothetical protein
MTIEGLINKLTQYSSWLYYRQWGRWELPAVAIAVLVLLLLAVRTKRKVSNVKQIRERSPIIGIRLAGRRARR